MSVWNILRGTRESPRSVDYALQVTPGFASGSVHDVGALAANTEWFSPVFDMLSPRRRTGALAQKLSQTVAAAGEELEIQFAFDPAGPWHPAPSSETGATRASLVVATGGSGSDNRVLISRAQPGGRYFRARLKSAGQPLAADTQVYIGWAPLF